MSRFKSTLISRVKRAMQSDDCNKETQSAILARLYDNSNDTGKELLDDAFIALCGYSLKTLIRIIYSHYHCSLFNQCFK